MARFHGRKDFMIVNEGIFKDGHEGKRQPNPIEEIRKFRFTRLHPGPGAKTSLGLIESLAQAMTAKGNDQRNAEHIPAGFTYLGQFIDHDLTLDKTGRALGENVSVDELLQGRSPALDLDNLYGRGPVHEPKFYRSDRVHLATGKTDGVEGTDAKVNVDRDEFDLPRVGTGSTASARRMPNIPDPRNDENLVVGQTHNAFIRFHNRVVDELVGKGVQHALFETARREVVKHYQWMIRHDFLPRIADPAIVEGVFANGRRRFEVHAKHLARKGGFTPAAAHPARYGSMPIEFSIAAYRMGHSMIRAGYSWNRIFPGASLEQLFRFSGTAGNLSDDGDFFTDPDSGSFERLPTVWIADWRRLYDFKAAFQRDDLAAPGGRLNVAHVVDTNLVDPLAAMPPGTFGPKIPGSIDAHGLHLNLAFRNLARGSMISLSSGQQLAQLFETPLLTEDEILNGAGGAKPAVTAEQKAELLKNTPLWFYILREAEVKAEGKRLGPLGSQIVVETFHRAMETSRHSIVRDPDWRPRLGRNEKTFEMVDLLWFAFDQDVNKLNPVGDP